MTEKHRAASLHLRHHLVLEPAHVVDRSPPASGRTGRNRTTITPTSGSARISPAKSAAPPVNSLRSPSTVPFGCASGLDDTRYASPTADGSRPAFVSQVTQLRRAGLESRQRVHRELRIGADRIPGIAVFRGAPQRRAAFAANPDRDRFLHRLRRETPRRRISRTFRRTSDRRSATAPCRPSSIHR